MCRPYRGGGEVYCRPCNALLFDWDNMTCSRYGSLASMGRPFNGYCQSNLLPLGDDVYEQSSNSNGTTVPREGVHRSLVELHNYIRASVALTRALQTCQCPDLVATNEGYAWGDTRLFGWMENVNKDRTCHRSLHLDDERYTQQHQWGAGVPRRRLQVARQGGAAEVEQLLQGRDGHRDQQAQQVSGHGRTYEAVTGRGNMLRL